MDVLRFLSSLRAPLLDSFMIAVSYVGTTVAVVAIFGWIYLNKDKEEAYGIGLSFMMSCLLCQGIKILARVPRPWNLDTSFQPVTAALPTATGYSFPSGHTQSISAMFLSIFYYNKKKAVRAISALLILLVAFSRMYLGCHTPLDVGAALLLTAAVTAVSWALWNRHGRSFLNDNLIPFFLLAFALVLLFLSSALLVNGTVDYANVKDSYESAGAAIGFAVSAWIEPRYIRFSVTGSFGRKCLRFMVAAVGALLIELGMKALFGKNIPLMVLRYALMVIWVMLLTPYFALRSGLASRERTPQRLPQI